MTLQITYHALDRLKARTNLTVDDARQAYTNGLPLQSMPLTLREYLTKRIPNYSGRKYLDSEYRLYKGFILIYRQHPEGGLALITSLVPPKYAL